MSAVVSIEKVVDRLGMLNAQIADLQKLADEAKAELLLAAAGTNTVFIGSKYRAAVSTFEVARVDYKKIAEKMGASAQMIAGNTKVIVSNRVALSDL